MPETPETRYGRLQEALKISGFSWREAQAHFRGLVETGEWKELGFDDDFEAFLASFDFSEFKKPVVERRELALLMASNGATQRAIAGVLGVSHKTIDRDLDAVSNDTSEDDRQASDQREQENARASVVSDDTAGSDQAPDLEEDMEQEARKEKSKPNQQVQATDTRGRPIPVHKQREIVRNGLANLRGIIEGFKLLNPLHADITTDEASEWASTIKTLRLKELKEVEVLFTRGAAK